MNSLKTILITSCVQDIASVNAINNNLIKSYKMVKDCEVFSLPDTKSKLPFEENYNEFFRQILKSPPRTIVITHPAVYRSQFFHFLLQILKESNTQYVFHLYGDFIRQIKRWKGLEDSLLNKEVSWVAPSTAYKKVVENLLNGKVSVVPFSFDKKTFFYSEVLREKKRMQLDILKDEKLFIYSGRLANQKNIGSLISYFNHINESFTNLKLIIVGNEDDFEGATIGTSELLGSQFAKVISSNSLSNVKFMESVSAEELNSLYNAADAFISLSLFHDEDFGCAPLEAMATGLPLILTSWGGFKDFSQVVNFKIHFLTVDVLSKGYEIKFSGEMPESFYEINRSHLQENVRYYYSLESVAEKLKEVFLASGKFKGFKEIFNQLAVSGPQRFFHADSSLSLENYRAVYAPFWEKNS